MRTRPELDLTIDELVLYGFRPGDHADIAAAVERELAPLLAAWPAAGAAPSDDAAARLDAGSFDVPSDAMPQVVGEQIALAVDRGLRGLLAPPRAETP
jgi:hypothetical protein